MKRLTSSGIKKYLIENYGECKHDSDKMKSACIKLAKKLKISSLSLFHYIIGEGNSTSLPLTSYGFDTAYGREVKETFEHYYYSI